MNGSYTVPTGISVSPNSSWVSPNWLSHMKRFISLMPSSMCWPAGFGSHWSSFGPSSCFGASFGE